MFCMQIGSLLVCFNVLGIFLHCLASFVPSSQEHQRQDWPAHKKFCLQARQRDNKASLQLSMWPFPPTSLHSITTAFMQPFKPFRLLDWNHYFFTRKLFTQTLTPQLLSSPFVENLTDGLSFPLSIIYSLQKLNIQPKPGPENCSFIYIVGANSAVEEAQVCILSQIVKMIHTIIL